MRKILIATTLLASTAAVADTTLCAEKAKLAEMIMGAHQQGMPMSSVLEAVVSPAGQRLIMRAYERPRFGDNSFRQTAIAEFRDRVHVECLRETTR